MAGEELESGMLKMIQDSLVGQYGAALKMLRGCLDGADSRVWHAAVGQRPFWHVVYHTLFYADLYFSRSEEAFRPQGFHREGYNFLGPQAWAPEMKIVWDQAYEKEMLVGYLEVCRGKGKVAIADETEKTLAGGSGFGWLKISRLELHLYNIRHIQHHTGQLGGVLRRELGRGVEWIGSEGSYLG